MTIRGCRGWEGWCQRAEVVGAPTKGKGLAHFVRHTRSTYGDCDALIVRCGTEFKAFISVQWKPNATGTAISTFQLLVIITFSTLEFVDLYYFFFLLLCFTFMKSFSPGFTMKVGLQLPSIIWIKFQAF